MFVAVMFPRDQRDFDTSELDMESGDLENATQNYLSFSYILFP